MIWVLVLLLLTVLSAVMGFSGMMPRLSLAAQALFVMFLVLLLGALVRQIVSRDAPAQGEE